jgi:hypothetical protein
MVSGGNYSSGNYVYRLEGSSYDGCNGWTSWYAPEIYSTYEKAKEELEKHRSTYTRWSIVRQEIK